MKPLLPRLRQIAGFTLVEIMVGAAVASILLGALMTGSIALQRSFSANDQLARAHADLLRVADFMSRDIRNARTFNATPNSSVLLTVSLGDYYNRNGTPNNTSDDVPNSPVLGRTGATYGASPMTVRYLKSGTRVAREVTRVDAGVTSTSTTWIADNVENLTAAVDSNGTVTFTSATAMNYRMKKTGTGSPTLSFVMASSPRNSTP